MNTEQFHSLADEGDSLRSDILSRTKNLIYTVKQRQVRKANVARRKVLIQRDRDFLLRAIADMLGLDKSQYEHFYSQWEND